HGQAAVMGDAALDAGAAGVGSDESYAGSPHGSGKDFNPLSWKADSCAVEAFDDGFLGGPSPGEALGAAAAVGKLGGGVDLGEEPRAGALDRERDPVD